MNFKEQIEHKLRRRLQPEEHEAITHLNNVSGKVVAEALNLGSPLLAISYLEYLTSPNNWPYLKLFTQEVVYGGESPQNWRRGRVLVPNFSLEQQLLLTPAVLLAPIGGEFDQRVIPRWEKWQAGIGWVGAPARPEPNTDYLTPDVPGTASLNTEQIEPVALPQIAMRRWIAGRLAAWLRSEGKLVQTATWEDLTYRLPVKESWSSDARIAALGLLHELRELGEIGNEIPGFRGPDEWYQE
jgi:hypothetical protein